MGKEKSKYIYIHKHMYTSLYIYIYYKKCTYNTWTKKYVSYIYIYGVHSIRKLSYLCTYAHQ